MIVLGDEVRDKITGFKGIAHARVTYLYGCVRIEIMPKSKKGDKVESVFFDESGVERIGNGINKPKKKVTGGPRHCYAQRKDPAIR